MALREFEFVSNDLDGYKHVFSKAASDFIKGHGEFGHPGLPDEDIYMVEQFKAVFDNPEATYPEVEKALEELMDYMWSYGIGYGDLGHIEGLLKAEEFYEMGNK